MQRNVLAVTLVCASAAAVLTGCGGGKGSSADAGHTTAPPLPASTAAHTAAPAPALAGLTAQQISDKAVAAMKGLASVTATVDGTSQGHRIRMNAAMARGGRCVSHVVIGGGSLDLIGVGTDTYAKGDLSMWSATAGTAKGRAMDTALKGRWLEMPASPGHSSGFEPFCDLGTFMSGLTTSSSKETKGKPTTIAGQQTLPVSGPDGGGITTLYVAVQGPPYVLKADHAGSDPGTMTFTGFGTPVPAVAPPASLTVKPGPKR